jgi:predicted regulator of Ras-like GTPase activity (Roadblock/LC7/MglB family)
MDAAQALADLIEISSQIQAAVIVDAEGRVVASTLAEAAREERVADAARGLVDAATQVRRDGAPRLTQLEAATPEGSVFVVRDADRTIAAATTPEPTVGLVLYDLKSCLRALAEDAGQAQPEARGAA